MPRFAKWLTGIAADAPADQVAHQALSERLAAVGHYLNKAIGGTDEVEGIHQLRVWTRRASAALLLFRPAVPNATRKRMKKTLRKLRNAAGAVRDCDVQLDRLKHGSAAVPKSILQALRKQRRSARSHFKALHRRLTRDDKLATQAQRMLDDIAWPKRHSNRAAPPFAAFCRQQLAPHAAAFFKLTNANLADDNQLHALRISAKHLRYLLELAPAVLPTGVHRQLYTQLSQLQDRAGQVHDQLAAVAFLQEKLCAIKKKSSRERMAILLAHEQQEFDRLQKQLLRWWSPARRARLRDAWNKVR